MSETQSGNRRAHSQGMAGPYLEFDIACLPAHQTEGQISIQSVAGHIRVRAQGRSFELRSGGLLALDQGSRHDVEAIEESAFLLTIAWPGERHTSDRPV